MQHVLLLNINASAIVAETATRIDEVIGQHVGELESKKSSPNEEKLAMLLQNCAECSRFATAVDNLCSNLLQLGYDCLAYDPVIRVVATVGRCC
jgi:hypothetical protein